MKASMITTEDIRNLGSFGSMEVELPDYKSLLNVKNQVSYVRKCYPREDGLTYTTKKKGECTIKIMVVRPEELKANKAK